MASIAGNKGARGAGNVLGSKGVAALALLAMGTTAAVAGPQRLARNMKAVPVSNPAEWFGPDVYPPDAIRSARQGRMVAEVGVDSVGEVVSCNIKVSSGTASLDSKTCELAFQRGVFNPATDRKGLPTGSVYLLPVRWVLPESEEAAPKVLTAAEARDLDGEIETDLTVDPDGKLIACKVVTAKLPKGEIGDPCSFPEIGAQITPGWTRDGRRVGAVIRRRKAQSVTVAP